MELKELKSLIKLITDTDITEFNMENEKESIHIKRGPDKEIIQVAAPVAPILSASAPAVASVAMSTPATNDEVTNTIDERYEAVTSPMVGTVYHRPSPEADPFIKVGDVVEIGQTLCLVEAMKLFNEIEADFKCKIIEIVKADAAPAEFGETIFVVERL